MKLFAARCGSCLVEHSSLQGAPVPLLDFWKGLGCLLMLPVPALPIRVASRDLRHRLDVSLRSFPVESVPVQDGDSKKINCL